MRNEDGSTATDRCTIDSQPTPEPRSDLSHPRDSAPTDSSVTNRSTIHKPAPIPMKRKHVEITSASDSSDSESTGASALKRGSATSTKRSKSLRSPKASKSSKPSKPPTAPRPSAPKRPVLETSDEESLPDWSDSDSDSEPDVASAAQGRPAPTTGGRRTDPASSTATQRSSQSAKHQSSPRAIPPKRSGGPSLNLHRARRVQSGRSANLAVANAYRIRPDDEAPPTSTTAREQGIPRFLATWREQDEQLRMFEMARLSSHPGRNYARSDRHMARGDASASSAPNPGRIRPDDETPPTSATFREARDERSQAS